MYHIIPMCCACLKTNKPLIKLSKNNIHLLDRLLTNPLDFEHLKIDIPLYVCETCNNFLEQIHNFTRRVTDTTNKVKGYVRQLKMGNNYVPTSFSNVAVNLNSTKDIKKLKNDLIIAKQPIVRLEKNIEVESSLRLHYINDCNENIEATEEIIDKEDFFIDTSRILDMQCIIDEEESEENCSFYELNTSDESEVDSEMEYFNTGILRSKIPEINIPPSNTLLMNVNKIPEINIPPSNTLVMNIRNKLASILEKSNDQSLNSENIKKEIIDIEETSLSDVKIKTEFDVVQIKSEDD